MTLVDVIEKPCWEGNACIHHICDFLNICDVLRLRCTSKPIYAWTTNISTMCIHDIAMPRDLVRSIISSFPSLKTLHYRASSFFDLHFIPQTWAAASLVHLYLSNCVLDDVGDVALDTVQVLFLQNMSVSDMFMGYFPSLRQLFLRACNITAHNVNNILHSLPLIEVFDVSQCPSLVQADLRSASTSLTSISLSKNYNLKHIALPCHLLYCDISNNNYLYGDELSLIVRGCVYLRKFVARECLQATSLHISSQQLEILDIQGCCALQSLYIDCVKMSAIFLKQCRAIKSIILCSHSLASLDLTQLSKLEQLLIVSRSLRLLRAYACHLLARNDVNCCVNRTIPPQDIDDLVGNLRVALVLYTPSLASINVR